MKPIAVNDWVIHHEVQASTHPAADAREVQAAQTGDLYSYVVDRVYRVVEVHPDGSVDAVDRGGMTRRLNASAPSVERAGWWLRWKHRRVMSRS